MNDEKEYIETKFSYTDQYGETTELNKTHETETALQDGDTYFLMCEFKKFLLACGYSERFVNMIQYVEDDEKIVKKNDITIDEMLAYTE